MREVGLEPTTAYASDLQSEVIPITLYSLVSYAEINKSNKHTQALILNRNRRMIYSAAHVLCNRHSYCHASATQRKEKDKEMRIVESLYSYHITTFN